MVSIHTPVFLEHANLNISILTHDSKEPQIILRLNYDSEEEVNPKIHFVGPRYVLRIIPGAQSPFKASSVKQLISIKSLMHCRDKTKRYG